MASMSKEEYLKRYLSVNAEEKKKKKRKKVHGQIAKVPKSRIVDDDVDLKSLLPENLSNTLEEDVGDNEPTVAEVIDERPEHVKQLEKYRASSAWKVLGQDDNSNSDCPSKRQERHDSDSDQSLPRRHRHDSDSDQSPPRRQRDDSDSDQSLPRRQRHDSDSDQSPPRKQKHEHLKSESYANKKHPKTKISAKITVDKSSANYSANKSRHDSSSDQSPPRRHRHDSDSDQSLPRKSSVNRKQSNKRKDTDTNQSPLRKEKKDSDSDQSPPRRRRKGSDSDQSPPRRRRKGSDSDQSPPRKGKQVQKVEKTLGGKKAGLSSAKQMRLEADELKRKEEEKFRQISDERLGRGAATVFRDKSGKRRNLEEEKRLESEEAKQKAKEDEKFKTWGKGLKQIEEKSKLLEDALHEVNKPLARYKDDEDLDQMLREMDRAEDPMLAFIKKKKKNAEPVKEKPKYKGPAPPPNRFGIPPGYRWDGVDRSNGFEKQIFSKQAERKATADQAYKWSVEDM